MSVFAEVKARVTMRDAISFLGLKATEQKGDQFRFQCPHCKTNDKRSLSVNLDKGYRCFASDKSGNDCIALVAHVQGISQTEAAKTLKEHFVVSSTEPRQPAEERERGEAPMEALAPLDYLEPDHPLLELICVPAAVMEAIGGGFAPKGSKAGRYLIPIRMPDGTLVDYVGIATRADQAPLLLFSKNIAERIKARKDDKPQPDELRKMFRVV